jgi:transcriptional regulator with XRE-family HTH domain
VSTIDKKLSKSKEYREAFVSAFLKRYIPFQVRTIRKKRGMSQEQLAEASKVTQGVISRAEDPDYGNLTFNTVLRIAAGFDLAFVGKFVAFSEFVKLTDEMTENALDLPSFDQERSHEEEPQVAMAAAAGTSIPKLELVDAVTTLSSTRDDQGNAWNYGNGPSNGATLTELLRRLGLETSEKLSDSSEEGLNAAQSPKKPPVQELAA